MTTFLRFFILSLTLLLGVTLTFGPALLFGLTATVLLAAVSVLIPLIRPSLKPMGLLWSVLGLGAVVVTLIDVPVSLFLPGLRSSWGIYLNLLPFLPLVALLPQERASAPTLGAELARAAKTGLLLTSLFSATALVRETLGAGSLTLVPDLGVWAIPGLKNWPLGIMATGAGGFFLAALAVVGYRTVRPRLGRMALLTEFWGTGREGAPASEPAQVPGPAESPASLETTAEWGEDLAAAVGSLGTGEKRRLLVIGSGNGEVAYHLAMLALERAKAFPGGEKEFGFRVRGVDHFSTRIETAIRGVYRDHQIDFIAPGLRTAWMTRGSGEDRSLWKVGSEPRLHVQFEVADFQHGPMFFPQPAHLIVLNQGIEYVTDDKKAALLKTVCDNLVTGGALVVTGPFKRELLPEGMKRTGATVFRKV